jgi:hypothetical protein
VAGDSGSGEIPDDLERCQAVGYRFSLLLSREITDDESAILQGSGCASAVFATDSLPTNTEVTVTKLDFDDTDSASLAQAIESALLAVQKVPDLGVPGMNVPPQPRAQSVADSDSVDVEAMNASS